jgi:hypothetical protein
LNWPQAIKMLIEEILWCAKTKEEALKLDNSPIELPLQLHSSMVAAKLESRYSIHRCEVHKSIQHKIVHNNPNLTSVCQKEMCRIDVLQQSPLAMVRFGHCQVKILGQLLS